MEYGATAGTGPEDSHYVQNWEHQTLFQTLQSCFELSYELCQLFEEYQQNKIVQVLNQVPAQSGAKDGLLILTESIKEINNSYVLEQQNLHYQFTQMNMSTLSKESNGGGQTDTSKHFNQLNAY